MTQTMAHLCESIQGAMIGYTQSDEITILLKDWQTFETQPWFGYKQSKMESVSASMASAQFNRLAATTLPPEVHNRNAVFDCRAFSVPMNDVNNCFLWRQQDASRNSVQMLGHENFSQKQMHGKNNSEVQDMLMLEKGINWNNLETWKRRGTCWIDGKLDFEIPIFSKDTNYINKLLE